MEKKGKENKFINKELIEEIKNNPQKKAWVVLGLYFLFFSLLILFIRFNQTPVNKVGENDNLKFSVNDIETKNYDFKYIIEFDNNKVIYEGNKNNDKVTFYKTGFNILEKFYKDKNNYYKEINGTWISTENPVILSQLTDISIVKEIIKNAMFISETKFNDSTKKYNYKITTNSLEKILNNNDIDIAGEVNDINVIVDSNSSSIKFLYDLSPYTLYKNVATNSSVSMEYMNFTNNS